jgi:hypothetical protein
MGKGDLIAIAMLLGDDEESRVENITQDRLTRAAGYNLIALRDSQTGMITVRAVRQEVVAGWVQRTEPESIAVNANAARQPGG